MLTSGVSCSHDWQPVYSGGSRIGTVDTIKIGGKRTTLKTGNAFLYLQKRAIGVCGRAALLLWLLAEWSLQQRQPRREARLLQPSERASARPRHRQSFRVEPTHLRARSRLATHRPLGGGGAGMVVPSSPSSSPAGDGADAPSHGPATFAPKYS